MMFDTPERAYGGIDYKLLARELGEVLGSRQADWCSAARNSNG